MAFGLKDIKAKYRELFVVEKSPEGKNKPKDIKKMARDFWYGKPHEERRAAVFSAHSSREAYFSLTVLP